MNRYEQYKETGIEMLGELPMHWDLLRLKDVAYLNSEVLNEDTDPKFKIQYIDIGNVSSNGTVDEIQELEFGESPSRARRIVKNGDTIFSTVRTYLKAISFIDEAPDNLIASTGYAVIRPLPKTHPRYLYYLLTEEWFVGTVVARSTGVAYPAINAPQIASIAAWLPPHSDQEAIAKYLDIETAMIDQLIVNKRQQIEKLNELRQITISRTVTQGLDSDAPMKDSGIEWIGSIPSHWELKRLKQVAQVRGGVAKGRDLGGRDTVSLPYIRVANVQDGYLSLEDIAEITVARDEIERYSLQSGDVLMNEGGDFDKLGRGFIWHGQVEPCLHQNHVFAVRPSERVESEWLNLITSSNYAKYYFMLKSKQSTNLASLSSTNLKGLPILIPPEDERRVIIEHVQKEDKKIQQVAVNIESQITKLEELRKITIHNAVTGKIKVTD